MKKVRNEASVPVSRSHGPMVVDAGALRDPQFNTYSVVPRHIARYSRCRVRFQKDGCIFNQGNLNRLLPLRHFSLRDCVPRLLTST